MRGGGNRRDHVDRVRAQWKVVRPELDTSPAGIVARVGRLAAYFDQSINALMTEYGLTRSSWDILASLRRVGAPYQLTPTELYRSLMRSSGWMINRLHELEQAGLVKRLPDPSDGRGVLVHLTRDGLRLVDKDRRPSPRERTTTHPRPAEGGPAPTWLVPPRTPARQ